MISLDFNCQQIRANALSRTTEIVVVEDGIEAQVFSPSPGAASDPVTELLASGEPTQATEDRNEFVLPDDQWRPKNEHRFATLAEREAIGKLNSGEKDELDRLSDQRRALKNPRSGEELLWEYEQRKITRDLVESLTRYVNFHKIARRP